MSIFTVIPKLWTGIFRAEARITADDGRSYSYRGNRDLSFTIWRNDEEVVSGRKKRARKKVITLLRPQGRLGEIHLGCLHPCGDTLYLPGEHYRLPTFLRPRLPALGMKFSRIALVELRTHWVEVSDEFNEPLALGILGYLEARGTFVEG